MNLIHWQTLQTLSSLQQHLYQQLYDLSQHCYESTLWIGNCGVTEILSVQVLETEAEIVLQAEIPNAVAESLDIQVTSETVCVRGEWQEVAEMRNWFELEFHPRRFQSIIPLPGLIQPHAAIAELNNGTLTLTLQKSWQTRRQVRVKLLNSCESLPAALLANRSNALVGA